MKTIKHFLLTVAALLCSTSMLGVEVEIDGINYDIITKAKQATVVDKSSGYYSGAVVIPESVEYEGVSYAVTSIGENAFSCCHGLTSVTIPNSVTSIGEDAFFWCYDLTSVHISDIAAWCKIDFGGYSSNPLSYARHLFLDGEEIKDLVIPNSVTSIGSYAFYGCSGLTSVAIPKSVKSIGSFAFYGCSGLTSVIIPNSVTSIGNYTFYKCSGLTSVTIPNSVTSIGRSAFYGCSGLTSVTIGNSVKNIEDETFAECSELTDVYCYAEGVPYTNGSAFEGSYVEYATLHVPDASIGDYKAKTPWSGFGTIVALTEEETGLEDIAVEDVNINDAPVYNLQGMKMQNVDNLPAGIYIKNGKKYIIK